MRNPNKKKKPKHTTKPRWKKGVYGERFLTIRNRHKQSKYLSIPCCIFDLPPLVEWERYSACVKRYAEKTLYKNMVNLYVPFYLTRRSNKINMIIKDILRSVL